MGHSNTLNACSFKKARTRDIEWGAGARGRGAAIGVVPSQGGEGVQVNKTMISEEE